MKCPPPRGHFSMQKVDKFCKNWLGTSEGYAVHQDLLHKQWTVAGCERPLGWAVCRIHRNADDVGVPWCNFPESSPTLGWSFPVMQWSLHHLCSCKYSHVRNSSGFLSHQSRLRQDPSFALSTYMGKINIHLLPLTAKLHNRLGKWSIQTYPGQR